MHEQSVKRRIVHNGGTLLHGLHNGLDIRGKIADLVEVCDDRNWNEVVGVHLHNQIAVGEEILLREIIIYLLAQCLDEGFPFYKC